MNILSIAYPFAPVTERTAGGAEQVLLSIDRKLTALGHNTAVVAAAGSKVSGRLYAGPKVPRMIDQNSKQQVHDQYKFIISKAVVAHNPDLIHVHGLDFADYIDSGLNVPVLVTLHLPLAWYEHDAIFAAPENFYFNCVSRYQFGTCQSSHKILGFIENGVETSASDLGAIKNRKYVLCLGRICPEKGYHLAIDAAAQAGVEIILAGQLLPYSAHQQYFLQQIAPRLTKPKARYIGPVGGKAKTDLLRNAKCLCITSLVDETSGLSAMESMGCGTPVVTFGSGALVDIVEHGKTGFIVRDEHEIASAIHKCELLDPAACIRSVRSRFDIDRMVSQYISLYRMILNRHGVSGAISIENAVTITKHIS